MPSEEIEKFRILEAEKVFRPTIRDWLIGGFENATWDQVRVFVWSFIPPTESMPPLLADIDEWEKAKKSPASVLVRENPRRTLRNELLYASARYVAQSNDLTWIGSRTPPEDTTLAIAWSNLSREFFLSPFMEDGISGGFLTIHGKPRMGKTGIGCDYGEVWHSLFQETEVLTNVPLLKFPSWVRYTADGAKLAQGIAEALIAGRRWLWIWDEPTLSKYGKGDAATSVAKNLDRFARIIPKLRGSLVYIEHREEGVPTVIQDFSQSHFSCERPGFALANLPRQRLPIRSIPKPKELEYRTGEAGYFELEDGFNWTGFFQALRYHPEAMMIEDLSEAEQGKRILAFLDKERMKPPKRGPGRPRKEEVVNPATTDLDPK